MKTIIKKSTPGGILRLDFRYFSNSPSLYYQKRSIIDVLHSRYGNRIVHEISSSVWFMELYDYAWTLCDGLFMDGHINKHKILKDYTYIKNGGLN